MFSKTSQKIMEQDNDKDLQLYFNIIRKITDVKLKKNADYRHSWKVFGLQGIIYQIGGKFIRIWNLHNGKRDPENESLKDSFLDIANYAIMGLQLLESGQIDPTINKLMEK